MQCIEVEAWILDGLVDETDVDDAIESHVQECAACRVRFGSLLTVSQSTAELTWQDLPVGFDERFRQRLTDCGPYPGADGGAVPLRLLFVLGNCGFSWVLFLMPSVALAVAAARSINASAGPLVAVSASDLAGVLLVMMLVGLVPAAVRLQRVTRECRS